MIFDVTSNLEEIRAGLSRRGRGQVPFAAARAINDVLRDIREAMVPRMRRVLEAPSRTTLGGMRIGFAKKRRLDGAVWFRETAGKGVGPGKYLRALETGGPRAPTRFERALRLGGAIDPGEWVVPASDDQRLNARITRGTRTRVLSQLRAFTAAGFDANASGSARSRRRRSRGGSIFIPGGPGVGAGTGLPRGIWQRRQGIIDPLFWITRRRPRYAPILGFGRLAERVARRRLGVRFLRRFAEAMRPRR